MHTLDMQLRDLWAECAEDINKRFGINAPPSPTQVSRTESTPTMRFGGELRLDGEVLEICDSVVEGFIPLEGVVSRECLYHALPSDICPEGRRDLATEYARQRLTPIDQEKWQQAWREVAPVRIRPNLVYDSYLLMEWVVALGGDLELDRLTREFLSMSRYGLELPFEEYAVHMVRRTQDIVVSLSHSELKVLTALLDNPTESYRRIAQVAELSPSWVSTRINRLKRKYILREHTTTPFSRIGIRTYHVLLNGPPNDDPSRFVAHSPFLYEIRPILNGPWQILARLAVPDSYENDQAIHQMVSMLNSHGIGVDVAETYSVGQTRSFYHYDTRQGKWEIPWVAMEGWGHRIEEEGLDHIIEPIDQPAFRTDVFLDELDFKILDNVHQGVSSVRALRKTLSISQNKLLGHMKKLRQDGLVRKSWSVHNIGLVERVALRVTDPRTASMVDIWARELPNAFLRYEENRSLLLIADLPAGDSSRMMDVLRSLRWPVTVSPLGSPVWGQWVFPHDQWDVSRQNWICPRESVRDWLDDLRHECEVTWAEGRQTSA
ncbi:MAG: winged helix-turn-helix transcriptional regulator [Candidatus Thorarchaeota archaeon]